MPNVFAENNQMAQVHLWELKPLAVARAKKRRITLSDYVREAVAEKLARDGVRTVV